VKQDRRDRHDRIYIKNLDAMHIILPMYIPKRCDNEAVAIETIDITAANEYLAKRNAGNPAFKYTLFHIFTAAIAKVLILRPHLNWFISGNRIYAHRDVKLAFMVKRSFDDHSEESIAKFIADIEGGSLIDQVHDYLEKFVSKVRGEKKIEKTSQTIGILRNMPLFILRFFFWGIRKLEYFGYYPKSFAAQDPCYSSAFLTNLGSIGLNASYHHLFEGGTMSIFALMDAKKMRPVFNADGTYEMKETIRISLTLDERITDGYYCSKSIKMLLYFMQHPELLDLPASEPIELPK